MYEYEISGYFFADDERIHFQKIVKADDNIQAMRNVIGEFALKVSLEGKTFRLDVIHYECW